MSDRTEANRWRPGIYYDMQNKSMCLSVCLGNVKSLVARKTGKQSGGVVGVCLSVYTVNSTVHELYKVLGHTYSARITTTATHAESPSNSVFAGYKHKQ